MARVLPVIVEGTRADEKQLESLNPAGLGVGSDGVPSDLGAMQGELSREMGGLGQALRRRVPQ